MNNSAFVLCAIVAGGFAAAQVVASGSLAARTPAAPVTIEVSAPGLRIAGEGVVATSARVEEQRAFAQAVQLYRGGQWSSAYGRFIVLADRGNARAARIALAMYRDGPRLYGSEWDASPQQLLAWERSALPESTTVLAARP